VPSPTPIPLERPQYKIDAVLDYFMKVVDVNEEILIPHPANEALSNIQLVVAPNSWSQVVYLDDLSSESNPVESFVLDGIILTVNFQDPGWLPGEDLKLQIGYRLVLPEQNAREGYGPSPFGYTLSQTNLVDWYPMVPPYQEDLGWVIHPHWIFGEYIVYPAADFEVTLDIGNEDLVVAASSLASGQDGILQYSLEKGRNFVFSISPSYQVLEATVAGTSVLGYVFPAYQVPGEAAFQATLESLALYSELYGPFKQDSLSMVLADFYHGMEYEGLYYLSKGFFDSYNGTKSSYLVAIAVHETAHQWWYGQVANDQAQEPWLDEAFCTFSELAYYEQLYPDSVDWWWGTRVNYYEPYGRIDRSIYEFQGFVDQYLNYRNATYLQGARFLADLKTELGEQRFYALLQEYALEFENEIATREDFFDLMGTYVDLDSLSWLGEYFDLE
jgi:hypothetical protein